MLFFFLAPFFFTVALAAQCTGTVRKQDCLFFLSTIPMIFELYFMVQDMK